MTTAFWLAALAIVALAWAIALPPLWRGGGAGPKPRREQNIEIARARLQRLEAQIRGGEIDAEEAARFRAEIERELLLDADADADADDAAAEETPAPPRRLPRAPLAAAVVCLPLVAAALYAALGEPGALSAAPRPPDLAQAATTLRERLQADDNEDGWILLGRAESELGRFDAAAAAFARAIEIGGETPAALALQVDALLMGAAARQENAAPATAAFLIARAIEIDPDHAPSLWLSGLDCPKRGRARKSGAILAALAGNRSATAARVGGDDSRRRSARRRAGIDFGIKVGIESGIKIRSAVGIVARFVARCRRHRRFFRRFDSAVGGAVCFRARGGGGRRAAARGQAVGGGRLAAHGRVVGRGRDDSEFFVVAARRADCRRRAGFEKRSRARASGRLVWAKRAVFRAAFGRVDGHDKPRRPLI